MPTSLTPNSPVPVVAPRGEIDLATARDLGSQLQEAAGDPGVAAVLDLTEVTLLDSVALGVVASELAWDAVLAAVSRAG